MNVYIEDGSIWKRKPNHEDAGVPLTEVTAVKVETKNTSVILNSGTGLRVSEPALTIAELLWGQGNFKRIRGGVYAPKKK